MITVIEILSWSNKQPGRERKAYEAKRRRIFQTETNLVEIDLLRAGEPMPYVFSEKQFDKEAFFDYYLTQ